MPLVGITISFFFFRIRKNLLLLVDVGKLFINIEITLRRHIIHLVILFGGVGVKKVSCLFTTPAKDKEIWVNFVQFIE